MRKLVIMRGAPGAGKSTWLEQNGLADYAVSPDSINFLHRSPRMDDKGKLGMDMSFLRHAWNMAYEIVEKKMENGELVVLDSTAQKIKDLRKFFDLAKRQCYDIACVDFSDVDIEIAKDRNKQRVQYKQVPEFVIDRAYKRIANNPMPDYVKVFKSIAKETELEFCNWLSPRPDQLDLKYNKVHHIGDLQGCYTVVKEYLDSQGGFKDDELYIFVGDYCDRGIENDLVMRWMIDDVMDRPNVVLLYGNHEVHLNKVSSHQDFVSNEFQYNTWPQLKKANITNRELRRFCQKLKDVFIYNWHGKQIICTHAGIAAPPILDHSYAKMPSIQFWKGVGYYDNPIDFTFSENVDGMIYYQVHGHRNKQQLPIEAAPYSFNLEGKVEFGGNLRVLTLDQEGNFEGYEIKNNVCKKYSEQTIYRDMVNNPIDAPWLEQSDLNDLGTNFSQVEIEKMRNHNLIKEKTFEDYPHISSFNFTRKAFYDRTWDEVNMQARGLFVNNQTNAVVARSYNKFFNIGEREDTQINALKNKLKFPVDVYVKENGFLGILGYDEVQDDLFFASKSTPDSDFAQWFKDIFVETVTIEKLGEIKDFLKNQEAGMVFEVNDPVNDPHMIEYNDRHVVLLDVVRRGPKFEKYDYKKLEQVARTFGLPYKHKMTTFDNLDSFMGWYNHVDGNMDAKYNNKHIEGFVIEDANEFMVKIKLPYYSFWKRMRALKDRIIRERDKDVDPARTIQNMDKDTRRFFEWALTKDNATLSNDIITLRKMYLLETY